ncbi:MAG: gliding motility protein GldN [Cyclobacteriaceae bacterium]|jgi:gliding motility associated protien GldN|nr:gliding motility protein GldN [Cyclobacteriaceae bacterium]
MKKISYVVFLCAFLSMTSFEVSYSQEQDSGYNPNSLYPIHESYQMFKKSLWRRMDLKEKQNKPFYSRNGDLSAIIINAVKSGLLIPYKNDSVSTRMSKADFLNELKPPEEGGELTEEEKSMGFGEVDQNDPFADAFAAEEELAVVAEYPGREFSILEIREDMFFDRNRSRMYYDIQAITIFLPSDPNDPSRSLETPLASFRYKDLVEVFRSMPKEAVWYNVMNSAEHRNFAEAFELRLFSSNLIKFANPEDERISEIYDKSRRDGILASQKLEHDMVEFENELWEF